MYESRLYALYEFKPMWAPVVVPPPPKRLKAKASNDEVFVVLVGRGCDDNSQVVLGYAHVAALRPYTHASLSNADLHEWATHLGGRRRHDVLSSDVDWTPPLQLSLDQVQVLEAPLPSSLKRALPGCVVPPKELDMLHRGGLKVRKTSLNLYVSVSASHIAKAGFTMPLRREVAEQMKPDLSKYVPEVVCPK